MLFEPDGYTNHQALICIMLMISISRQNGGHRDAKSSKI